MTDGSGKSQVEFFDMPDFPDCSTQELLRRVLSRPPSRAITQFRTSAAVMLERSSAHLRTLLPHARARRAAALLADSTKWVETLLQLVEDAYPIVEADAQMLADITRHAPLSPTDHARHDSTLFPSEKWLEDFDRMFGSAADITEKLSEG